MNNKEFREFGIAAIDYLVNYLENVRQPDVLPSVKPGYIQELLPKQMPEKSEDWKTIMSDFDRVIMPGISHWQSPNFHAYYPTTVSFPSIIAEMLSAGLGLMGFNWMCSPVCTELEVAVMDWLANFFHLPKHFLNSAPGAGGGVMQGSASEAILVAVLAARDTLVRKMCMERPELSPNDIRSKLVAYSSDQSNCCIEKAGIIAAVEMRLLSTGADFIFRGETLKKAIVEDLSNGKIPLMCIGTLGTTNTCAYDDVSALASICEQYKIWFHVDAAYAGTLLSLPEFHNQLAIGLDRVDSLNINLDKTMLINFDSGVLWMRNSKNLVDSFNVDRVYLEKQKSEMALMPEYRHWQIALGRRFRALKVWITLRALGAENLRNHFRNYINLAQYFEQKLLTDNRFEIIAKRSFGLVCFRLKGDCKLTTLLVNKLMDNKKIFVHKSETKLFTFIRFVICGHEPNETDMDFAFQEIVKQTNSVYEFLDKADACIIKLTNGIENIHT